MLFIVNECFQFYYYRCSLIQKRTKPMKRTNWLLMPLLLLPIVSYAIGSTNNSSKAMTHSAKGAVHLSAAGIQGASTVAAIPLLSIGTVGSASLSAGEAILEYADTEFEIDEESFSVLPSPDQVIKQNSGTVR